MRIVHLSDVHIWRYTWNASRLMGIRALGMVELLLGRLAGSTSNGWEPSWTACLAWSQTTS